MLKIFRRSLLTCIAIFTLTAFVFDLFDANRPLLAGLVVALILSEMIFAYRVDQHKKKSNSW